MKHTNRHCEARNRGPRKAPAFWGEDERRHEVKAYLPDMPTEFSRRGRRGNLNRFLSIILAVIMLLSVFSALPLTVSAADTDAAAAGSIHEGTVNGCHWEFDDSTGVLTIEGSGWLTLPQFFAQENLPNRGASLRKVVIGEGITDIDEQAFEGTHYLEEVVLPSTLIKIGSYAFSGCIDLKTINFPPELLSIGRRAFSNCSSLTSVTLNDGLSVIDSDAFSSSGLTRATIPASVTTFRPPVFNNVNAGFVIYGYKGTEAETYAKNNNITFRSLIDSVDVTVVKPIAGQRPSYTASVPDGADYNAYIIAWTGQQGIFLSDFEPGKDYRVGVTVSTKDGYAFDPDRSQLPGKLNGVDCTFTVSSENNAYLYYKFTCPPFCSLSGSFTSYLDTPGITIELLQDGVQKYSASYQEDCGSYTLNDVSPVSYTMRVSKANHATRDYAINFNGEDLTQDVKLHPVGDINGDGKITNYDYSRVNQHTAGTKKLTDYPFACADVNSDSKVTNFDAGKINQHASDTKKLW